MFPITPTVALDILPGAGIYSYETDGVRHDGVVIGMPWILPPAEASITVANGGELRIAASAIRPILDSKLADEGFSSFPVQILRKPQTIVERLAVTFATNDIVVTGKARVEMFALDHYIEFTIRLRLWASDDQITAWVERTDIDGSVAIDIADFFSDGAAGELIVDKITASLGALTNGSIGITEQIGSISRGISPYKAVLTGKVTITPEGIGIPIVISGSPTWTLEKAPYYRGHRETREVHRPQGCGYGNSISANRLRLFPTAAAAVFAGYDGCAYCLPEFNTWSQGRVEAIVFASSAKGVSMTLRLAEGTSRAGLPVGPLEEKVALKASKKVPGTFTGAVSHLVPGEWDVTTTVGGHAHVQRVTVAAVPSGKSTKAATHLTYRRDPEELLIEQP